MEINGFFAACQSQFHRFCLNYCRGFNYPTHKFILDMIQGIIASQSVCIAKIGRALQEKINLDKVTKRLIYHLDKENMGGQLLTKLHQTAAQHIAPLDVAVLDITDIQKPHAKAMEGLREVRDGSKKTLGKGFWLLSVIAAKGQDIIPLHMHLYSFSEVQSENLEILQTINQIQKDVNKKLTWVIDRAGDRNNIMCQLLDNQTTFVIRGNGFRNLLIKIPNGFKNINMLEIARSSQSIISVKVKKGQQLKKMKASYQQVSLPNRPDQVLSLITVANSGAKPLMLLTNLQAANPQEIITRALEAYFLRWRIEEVFRHIKTQYLLEKINVQRIIRLKNLVAVLAIALFFIYVEMGRFVALAGMNLFQTHTRKAKRKLPKFIYYTVSAIVWLVFRFFQRRAFNRLKNKIIPLDQLPLFNTR
jgi:hypothetical protein